MDYDILEFLARNGYIFMFLLMIVEGPIVTMAAAFLASLGLFSLPFVLFISVFGDLVGDFLWYSIGRRWGLSFVRGPGKYIGITENTIQKMDRFFERHGGKTIFFVKSTTGLCLVTFVAAGVARMDLKKFFWYSLLGGFVWSATLVGLGYFFGVLYAEIAQYISWAGWIVGILAILTFVVIGLYKKGKARKLLSEKT